MALISLQNISIAFGGAPLIDGQDLQIEKQQRVCLLGRNGAGKTTLMKIIEGRVSPDSGMVQYAPELKVSYFAQRVPQELSGSVFEIIAGGLGERGELLARYHREEQRIARTKDTDHRTLTQLHEALEQHHAWQYLDTVGQIAARMSLDPDWDYTALSGGQKRRVLLASALVSEPDLLLLDEPTNHLDITTIAWMEEFLLRENLTLLFVTHDRMLLRRLATRIVELDNGVLYDWSCDYDTFLQRKQALLDAQEKEWARFDKKLAQEEVWIRQGIKARRTRNEGRVRALKQMREARRKRRQAPGSASMKLAEAQQSGNLVIEAQGLAYSYDNQPLIQDFSTIITRGDKIGIIGPNGCGKTTLLNLLLGYLAPHAGTVRHGTNLAIRYYDQLREQIDESKTVWENVLPNGDTVTINGNSKHIIPYLQDFLFTPDRAKTPVTHLSGGERNRLLLARLFTQPANLLVLDEPTNDLDAETLELLEELLVNFQGTLLLISHDRTFLNNVVTSTLVFEGKGRIAEYVGGYDDWIEQQQRQTSADGEADKIDKKALYLEEKKARQKKKLSFKEAREMEALPGMIESLEAEQAQLQGKLADHTFYQDKSAVAAARARLAELETALAETYARWEYLESLSS